MDAMDGSTATFASLMGRSNSSHGSRVSTVSTDHPWCCSTLGSWAKSRGKLHAARSVALWMVAMKYVPCRSMSLVANALLNYFINLNY